MNPTSIYASHYFHQFQLPFTQRAYFTIGGKSQGGSPGESPKLAGAQGSSSLRSARGVFWWSRLPVHAASVQIRAFSVASPMVCNDIPQELLLFPRLCTDTFLAYLKTYLFVRTGVGSASEWLLEGALYNLLNEQSTIEQNHLQAFVESMQRDGERLTWQVCKIRVYRRRRSKHTE